jgi:hypothetical protein
VPIRKFITACTALVALAGAASGATYSWNAASGLFPDQVDPTMVLTDTATPEGPVLSGGVLVLSTSDNPELMNYQQTGPAIAMPSNLQIDANLRWISGNSFAGPTSPRTPVNILFTTSTGVGNTLFIGQDRLFLLAAPDILGPNVVVDTEAFHEYRITVDGTAAGSAVQVLQDGIAVLSGTIFNGGVSLFGSPRVGFGEGTTLAQGVSEFRSFSHNAAAVPEPASALVICAGALGLVARFRRVDRR